MTSKVFIKPTLELTSRQWRKLMARVFEREERGAGQFQKYVGQGPAQDPAQLAMKEESTLNAAMGKEYDFQPDKVESWKKRLGPPGDEEFREGIAPERLPQEPGHVWGGNIRGPMAKFDPPNPQSHGLTGAIADEWGAYEPPVSEMRQWRSGMRQSEDMARAVAEQRGLRGVEDEVLEETPELLMRGPTPSRKGSLQERRGIRSTMYKPGALLPPRMLKAVEKGGHLPTGAELMTARPPETKKYSRLMMQTEHGETPLDVSWPMAAKLLYKQPNKFRQFTGKVPPADVLSLREKGGSSYERRVFRPVEEAVERSSKVVETVSKETKIAARQELKAREGSKAAVDTASSRLGEGTDKDRLFKEALLLDKVWKDFVGGKKTLTGRAWMDYLAVENKRHAGARKIQLDARDYFQTVALKWLHEPEKTVKRYPREVKSLESIFAEVEKTHGPIFQ